MTEKSRAKVLRAAVVQTRHNAPSLPLVVRDDFDSGRQHSTDYRGVQLTILPVVRRTQQVRMDHERVSLWIARAADDEITLGISLHANIAQAQSVPETQDGRMIEPIQSDDFANAPATIRLGDLEVRRLGYGAMRLPGKDVWGEPDDPNRARQVLRRAVELGINFIDTAWYYGPLVSNRLIAEALHPYPRDLVIATKLGGKRLPDKSWAPALRPEELRSGVEEDLRTLRLERLDVVHLRHMPAAGVPLFESLDALLALQKEGKIRHLALSNVNARELEQVLARTPIVAVQNLFNVSGGGGAIAKYTHSEVEDPEGVLELCTRKKIAFLPFFPLAVGNVARENPRLAAIAEQHRATPHQVALAWLLARSPVILPIPGTSSVGHLEQNWEARRIALTPSEVAAIGNQG